MKKLVKVLTALALSSTVFLPLGQVFAVNTTSSQVSANQESKPSLLDNQTLRLQIYNKLNDVYPNNNIEVTAFNNQVLLTGQVTSKRVRSSIVKSTIDMAGNNRVLNYLSIGKKQTTGQTSKDALITTQINTKLLTVKGVDMGNLKVVTTNGVVYLLGQATVDQKSLIISNIKGVGGVKRVVDLLEVK